MSIKKSQAILKCFIDLKSSVWFTLGSEDETMFCDIQTFFSSTAGQGFQNTKLPAVLSVTKKVLFLCIVSRGHWLANFKGLGYCLPLEVETTRHVTTQSSLKCRSGVHFGLENYKTQKFKYYIHVRIAQLNRPNNGFQSDCH